MRKKLLPLFLLPFILGSCVNLNETMDAMATNQAAIIRSNETMEESIRLGKRANELLRENLKHLEQLNQKLKEADAEQS